MTTKKKVNKSASYEDYFFLTITLDDRKEFGIGPVAQFHNTYCKIYDRLDDIANYIRLRPELTENGILHYHAIYRCKGMKEYIKLYKTLLPYFKHKYGYIKNVAVRDFQNVYDYIHKSKSFMNELLGDYIMLEKDPLLIEYLD